MLLYQPGGTNPNLPRVNWEWQTLITWRLIICSSEKTTLQSLGKLQFWLVLAWVCSAYLVWLLKQVLIVRIRNCELNYLVGLSYIKCNYLLFSAFRGHTKNGQFRGCTENCFSFWNFHCDGTFFKLLCYVFGHDLNFFSCIAGSRKPEKPALSGCFWK